MSIVEVRFEGKLDVAQVTKCLEAATTTGSRQPIRLLVDCRAMEGYDSEARRIFTTWHWAGPVEIERTAVITTRQMWHAVVSTMSTIVRRPMRAFQAIDEARKWLSEGDGLLFAADGSDAADPRNHPAPPREPPPATLDDPTLPREPDLAYDAASMQRGAGLLAVVRAIQERRSSPEWGQILASVPEARRAELPEIQPLGWYPAALAGDLMESYRRVCFPHDAEAHRDAVREIGAFIAEHDFHSIAGGGRGLASPRALIRRLPELWSRYYRGIVAEVGLSSTEPYAECTVRGVRGAKYLHWLSAGWTQRMIEKSGAASVCVDVVRPASVDVIEPKRIEFEMRWRTTQLAFGRVR